MKSLFTFLLIAALLGAGLGAVLAYVEVPTATEHAIAPLETEASSQAAAKLSLPKAEMPELVYQFGTIERGTSMSHAFKIRNTGELPLRVEVVSTTCKCTVGDLANKEIAPNEESEVLLEWAAKTPPGPFRHGAVLSTNDPTQTRINLTVEGRVVESTSMSPSELIFGSVPVGQSAAASLHLMTFAENQQPEVSSYELSDPELAELMEVDITPAKQGELPDPQAKAGVKVAVKYNSGNTIGPFRGWLTLKTNLEKAQILTIPIVGSVVGDVSIFGPGWNENKGLLRMGTFPGDAGKSVTLNLSIRNEQFQDAELKVAKVDPPALQVALGKSKQLGEKLRHRSLQIEVPAGTAPIVRLGEPVSSDAIIVLRADDEQIPEIRLRVQFAVE